MGTKSALTSGIVNQNQNQELKTERESVLSVQPGLDKYTILLKSISQGFFIVEVIFNTKGEQIDLKYIEASPAFEKQMGLRDVTGKYLSEIMPGEERFWLDRLARVALRKENIDFIDYSQRLNKWFEVSAFIFGEPGEHLVAALFSDVTGRKQAEEILRESRERYQALIETNVDFIWEIDREGRYTYCSPQMKHLWTIDPGEMIGKTPFEFLPEDERAKSLSLFQRILRKAVPFTNLGMQSFDAAGKLIHTETSGVPFFSYHGELLGYRGITRDVTERKIQEEQLRNSELQFRTIVETANEGVCMIDEDLNVRYVNNKILEMIQYSTEELIGSPVSKFLSHEESGRIKKIIPQVKKGIRRNFEIKIIRKDNHEIIASINATALKDDEGRYAGYVGMITDITDRVLIEKDLKRTKKKLQTALRNASIGTWEWNLKTNDIISDRRTEDIFGIKPGTLAETGGSFWSYIHEEDIQYVDEKMKKALAEGTMFEAIYRTKPFQGKCNYVLSKATITRDRKGRPYNVSGVCFDVTHMKEGTEKALIRLNEELLRSNSDLQQFAYVASHDLQEPLRMVSSFTQLLQQRYADKLDKDANEYINFAVNGSRRMYELLNGLLAYSRIQTRGREFAEVDMNQVVEKVKANIKLLIEEGEAVINFNELPVVRADENQMIQLMQNLIENAIKFTAGRAVITISSAQRGDMQIFTVRDNGIGIEQVYFEKIFRIFQRLHHSEYPGTGIGLAICQRIVERHGGRIWVNSKPGEGSAFSFSLPIKPAL